MIRWLVSLWRARQRRFDLQILWPTCREQASDLDHAKAAFAVHAFNDEAWTILGHDGIVSAIDKLTMTMTIPDEAVAHSRAAITRPHRCACFNRGHISELEPDE